MMHFRAPAYMRKYPSGRSLHRAIAGGTASLIVAGATSVPLAADAPSIPAMALSGGALTTADAGAKAYSQLPPTLSAEQCKLVADGQKFFETKWAFYWFEQGLWGRGPTSNAESCATCHVGSGRGKPPTGDEPAQTLALRLSLPGGGPHGGPNPLPNYGDRLQTFGVARLIPAEGQVHLRWMERRALQPGRPQGSGGLG